jgi:hypothetical protein
MRVRTAVFVCVAIVAGLYYRWAVRAAGEEFHWGQQNLDGYYDLLARGFAGGHLYLPFEPDPKLLALPDPYDPAVDDSLKLWDTALYNRRYYLYHGAGPAFLLFLPWRLITRHDLPENYASFLLCFGGFVFSGAALLGWLRVAKKEPGPFMTAVLLCGLAFCTSVPFLLSRTWVYEIAIGGAYCCSSAGIWFLVRGLEEKGKGWLAASGAAFGLALACRPHLGLLAVAASAIVLMRARRCAAWFLVPIALAGIGIGVYNFERFGNPAEFGIRYMLTGRYMNSLQANSANIVPASFYLAAAPPETSAVFPWIRLPWPPRDLTRPIRFFLEPTVGALWLAPFLPALLLIPLLGRAAMPLALLTAGGMGIFLFLAVTGMCTQRYEVDFLPVMAMAALTGAAALNHPAWRGIVATLVLCGVVVNVALGVAGPNDEMIQRRPDRYVRLSRMFTPPGFNRLALNPAFALVCPPSALVQFSAGTPQYRYEFVAERNRILSRRGGSESSSAPAESEYTVAYVPSGQEIVVSTRDRELLRHRIGSLVVSGTDFNSAERAGCKRQ